MSKSVSEQKRKEGWWMPARSNRFHYFVGGRSLCGGWAFPDYSRLDPDTGNAKPQKTDCKSCFRKLVKRRQKMGVDKIQ